MLRHLNRLSRYSLRGLLLAMTACCLAMGVWSTYVKPFRNQAAANRRLADLGMTTESVPAKGPEWQRWLVETMVDPSAFVHTTRADLRSRPLAAEEMSTIAGLKYLQELYLDRSSLDAAGAVLLGGFHDLRTLSLTYVGLDDEEFAAMPTLPALQTLYLTGNPLSERSVAKIRELPALETLYLRWTRIPASAAVALRQSLPDCRVHHHALKPEK